MLNTVFIILASSWFLCVLAFLRVTNRDFWQTFWSTVTGWQFTVDSFKKSDDPETKMLTIFENHHSFTTSIRDEVITYMHANWAAWERTNPAWFTLKFIASVGDEFIPGRALQQLNEAAAGERKKRASLYEDENNRDESSEIAIDIMATSTTTTKLTHPIRLAHSSLVSLVLH